MSYGTGSATTIANLVSALTTFAVANAGMTLSVNRSEQIPSASSDPADAWTVVALSKAGKYWWIRYQATKLFAMISNSGSGAGWETITGRPPYDSELTPITAPFTSYHLFTEGTVVHAAIEMSNGAWTHLNFGDITKYGSWTGGNFFAVTNCPTDSSLGPDSSQSQHFLLFGAPGGGSPSQTQGSSMYLPYNSKNYAHFGYPIGFSDPDFNGVVVMGQVPGIADRLMRDQPNAANGRAVAPRAEAYLIDNVSGGSGLLLPLGYIPNIRPINVRDLNPKDLVNTDWMVFPCQARNSFVLNQYANTYNLGWAVRK